VPDDHHGLALLVGLAMRRRGLDALDRIAQLVERVLRIERLGRVGERGDLVLDASDSEARRVRFAQRRGDTRGSEDPPRGDEHALAESAERKRGAVARRELEILGIVAVGAPHDRGRGKRRQDRGEEKEEESQAHGAILDDRRGKPLKTRYAVAASTMDNG
jgi:hypothetical protein